jgi:hypothetical protein
MGKKNSMLKEKIISESFQEKKEKSSQIFLSTWARRFNIFVTLADYCGGYPRARG